MSDKPPSNPEYYQIRIKGHLDSQWAAWFDGLTITLEENGDTLLTGSLADQAALHGLLKKNTRPGYAAGLGKSSPIQTN